MGLITGGIDYREPVGSITGFTTQKKGAFAPSSGYILNNTIHPKKNNNPTTNPQNRIASPVISISLGTRRSPSRLASTYRDDSILESRGNRLNLPVLLPGEVPGYLLAHDSNHRFARLVSNFPVAVNPTGDYHLVPVLDIESGSGREPKSFNPIFVRQPQHPSAPLTVDFY